MQGRCSAQSPQPALVRVAARGQPSGHLASGGGAAIVDGSVLSAGGLKLWRQGQWRIVEPSPQPALVRVAARGQPSGHLASGGGLAG